MFILVTFEDKRKENFDKGQAELERRRAMLRDQQQREVEERLAAERAEQEKRERIRCLEISQDFINCFVYLQTFYILHYEIIIIIIIFYFENVAFFYAKLGSDVCPWIDNHNSGETLQDLTRPLSGKIAISQLSTHGYWGKFLVAGCPSTPIIYEIVSLKYTYMVSHSHTVWRVYFIRCWNQNITSQSSNPIKTSCQEYGDNLK